MDSETDAALTAKELAEVLPVNLRKIREWHQAGIIPVAKKSEGDFLFNHLHVRLVLRHRAAIRVEEKVRLEPWFRHFGMPDPTFNDCPHLPGAFVAEHLARNQGRRIPKAGFVVNRKGKSDVDMSSPILSAKDLSIRLGVWPGKVLIWYHSGHIPAEVAEGACYRFSERVVKEVLEWRAVRLQGLHEDRQRALSAGAKPSDLKNVGEFDLRMTAKDVIERVQRTGRAANRKVPGYRFRWWMPRS